jgi:hypothetical protein
MKKNFSRCGDCGEDTFILTQVSSGLEVVLLCSECYKNKYSQEMQNNINYVEKEKK